MEEMSFCCGLFLICSHEYMLTLGIKGKMIKKDNQGGCFGSAVLFMVMREVKQKKYLELDKAEFKCHSVIF